ncbi:IclR family transcriptional regulator [Paraburkholderia rhizosphaerae]|uniref:IclR family transcriptional regulator n=1 Tax=Paraburkholderia rhizosphaerae TaxID=480658 RepID=A0A4R8LLP0_9BURK|nr:IclR family transcriptional regulator [Paraburkholderia rhizosphaerae]TDY43927.1 IclR family transcriptional regulator [Paraburkholderia rhizosphaerae]
MDKTLLKGLMVLEALAALNGEPLTIQALAIRLGLTKSNAHRTLQTLAHAGYAVRDESSGVYRSTLKLFELGTMQISRLDVRHQATPVMRQLADLTEETVHLSVLDGDAVIYIDKIDSPQPVRAYSVVGGRAPAHCVATGKALLAFQAADYLDRKVRNLHEHTLVTITDRAILQDELRRIGRCGCAVNRGEWRDSVGGLAAPVFDGLGVAVAAIGISGPLDRLSPKRMKALMPEVLKAGAQVSRSMGFRRAYFSTGL